jgi:hypothetical protein
MPHTDYTDPEIAFPRLEARIQHVENEADAYWLQIWLWEKPGVRREVFNRKRAGSWRDAHEIIKEQSRKYDAEVGEDDIYVGSPPGSDV